jgi:OPA family glycerol-3-phosphate transporter-like MFS transporter
MDDTVRLRRWQCATGAVLLVGYAGYYVCRSNLSVAAPLLLADPAAGLDKSGLGAILSAGVLAYAVGKVTNGVLADFLGGRIAFLGGMLLSLAATIWFGAGSGALVLGAAWVANRFVQSAGWGALVKVASTWFESRRYGVVMALLSQSYLFGDALGRLWLGALLGQGLGWRALFTAAAATLLALAVVVAFVLRSSPRDVGLQEPEIAADNVYGDAGGVARPNGLVELIGPYLRRLDFWVVCLASFGLTLVRETFNAWTPTYLVEVFGLSQAEAAQRSAVFPLVGGFSVLLVGAQSDRGARAGRLATASPFLALAFLVLVTLSRLEPGTGSVWALLLVGAVAFLVIGPYSLLAGAIALDLGGRRGSSTAAGLIDSAGYLGGVLSGYTVGRLAQAGGWSRALDFLAVVTAATTALTIVHGWRQGSATRNALRVGGEDAR